jgi:dihydrofolate reductase
MAQRLRVHAFTISVDGFGAGPDQSLEQPLGVGGEALHKWFIPTRTFQRVVMGNPAFESGTTGIDEKFAADGFEGIGATIMGRNMFGPIRGEWADDSWKGWWGDNPPYHHPVFVLTHYPHDPIVMEGGTVFNFVTDGIESALEQAFRAANGQDVRLGGGVSAVQQYVRAGLVDYLHLALSPVLLGSGERLFDDLASMASQFSVSFTPTPDALHIELSRT